VFPGGLFKLDDKGRFRSETVNLTITAQPIDDSNAPAGTPVVKSVTITRSTNTPQRITETLQVPMGRYTVTVTRSTPPAPDSKTQNTFNWTGLKFKLEKTSGKVYGDTTLVSVKIRATNGISSDAANKFRVRCTRKLKEHGSGPFQGTRSPADAYIDIVTNATYGAGRSLASIDIAQLIQSETHWGAEGLFDGIFSSRVTLWDALSMVLQGVAAVPIRKGAKLGLVQDGKRLPPAQMFSDANIVADTFEASYSFDRPGEYAGYQVEYRDPQTFNPAYVQYPPNAVDLETVTLFGCTVKANAEKFARLLWNRRLYGRQNVVFDTELEGFIANVGRRILISTNAVQWGDSGQVIRTIGSEILLDRSVDLSQYSNPVMVLRSEQGVPSSFLPVTQGSSPRHVTLGSGPFPVPIIDIMESKVPTQWAIGDNNKRIRDFVVNSIQHRGRNITAVSGAIYDERLYDGTFLFQGTPV
jgi:predicted phage tail protein